MAQPNNVTASIHHVDIFADLLNLEDKYHAEGYTLGAADGARAGRIEGRTFGLERGFEKFLELGRLGGRGAVWDARLNAQTQLQTEGRDGGGDGKDGGSGGRRKSAKVKVAPLKGSDRLKRQVERLKELTDPESLSTVNDEESVNAFDDRLREARAKATLISKMAGERDVDVDVDVEAGEGEVEGQGKGKKAGAIAKKGAEMEDFAGLPMGRRKEG